MIGSQSIKHHSLGTEAISVTDKPRRSDCSLVIPVIVIPDEGRLVRDLSVIETGKRTHYISEGVNWLRVRK